MTKGFYFWCDKNIGSYIWLFWIVAISFFAIGVVLSFIFNRNVIIFLVIAIIPYLFAAGYRRIHGLHDDLEDGLESIDPAFYQKLVETSSKAPGIRIGTKEETYRRAQLFSELMKWHNSDIDQRILRYIRNARLMNSAAAFSFSAWYIGGVLLFIYFMF